MAKSARKYPIYLSPKAIGAYLEFLNFLNEEKLQKDEVELAYRKDDIFEQVKKKGFDISKSSIDTFLMMAIKAQKSRRIFDIGNKVALR